MMKSFFAGLALPITLIASVSNAAEFFVIPGTNTLLVLGETEASDAETIQQYINDKGVDTFILRGPGGDLESAFAIADVVLENKINTVIPEGTDCASACSIIFVAGDERTMEPGSRLGVHLPFIGSGISMNDYCKKLIKIETRCCEGCLSFSADSNINHCPNISPGFLLMLNLNQRNEVMTEFNNLCLSLTYKAGLEDIRRINKIFDRDEISPRVIDQMVDTPSSEIFWFLAKDSVELGLTNTGF